MTRLTTADLIRCLESQVLRSPSLLPGYTQVGTAFYQLNGLFGTCPPEFKLEWFAQCLSDIGQPGFFNGTMSLGDTVNLTMLQTLFIGGLQATSNVDATPLMGSVPADGTTIGLVGGTASQYMTFKTVVTDPTSQIVIGATPTDCFNNMINAFSDPGTNLNLLFTVTGVSVPTFTLAFNTGQGFDGAAGNGFHFGVGNAGGSPWYIIDAVGFTGGTGIGTVAPPVVTPLVIELAERMLFLCCRSVIYGHILYTPMGATTMVYQNTFCPPPPAWNTSFPW